MLHASNATSGLDAISQNVLSNFGVKDYTAEMLAALLNPLADLAKTAEAYAYFTQMYDHPDQDYTTPDGKKIEFSRLSPEQRKTLHDAMTKILSDYQTINVPYDQEGDTTPLLNADGSKASLLDLISNPNGSFHVNFTTDEDDQSNQLADSYVEPANGSDPRDNLNYSENTHACSNSVDFTITGSASTWEKTGALNPSTSDPQGAASAEAAMEAYLVNHL